MATRVKLKGKHSMLRKNRIRKPNEVIEIVVFLRDRTGIHFNLEDGHLAQADELLELVIEEQGLPAVAKQALALWIVSDLLDIRMKRSHQPYHIVQKWDELCAIYTDAKFEDIVKSEPVLMAQRDVYFTLEQERSIQNEEMLCLLYHEAKTHVIEGRYILYTEDYHRLAGIQALIHLGKYNPKEHIAANYRSLLVQFYPEHMYQKQKFLFFSPSKSNENMDCEEFMINAHQQISNEFGSKDIDDNICELYQKYLDICRTYPFYGSAFFNGQIERPVNRFKKFMNIGTDIKCIIAINTECVNIIDMEKNDCVLTVPFTQLSWRYREAQFDVDDDSMPCLFLQFLYDCPVKGRCTKLIEVYSREAKLMDALITSCVKHKLEIGAEPEDFVDGDESPSLDFHILRIRILLSLMHRRERQINIFYQLFSEPSSKPIHKMDRLCCSTYSCKGEKID
ncbi:hypothetical protein LOTGIDRAFT_230474 [Lottia gigantea]|uniref:FERM domain-containing protein 8 n=1 Tax=Lottia gigantea TaxID=225164 RepID=V4AG63_LOTGI|nr:hypothetical protein LOTGIDRAFT_230474 [Lottia gigantea]ESP03034.1 hypothetical protein LOTGIDRAFT_230474 [Lottia gigantea]